MYKDIAESKQADEQIESLARFPAENPSPVLRIAADGTLLYANEASESLLKEWNCRVGQVVAECWRQWVAEAFESRSETQVETEHAGRTFSFAIAPVAEAGYVNVYGRDITERKKSEDALKLHELRLQSLLDLNKMVDSRQKEVLDYVLEEMVKIIQSQFGFIALMSPDESVTTIYSWSKATMEECKVLEHPIHSPIDQAGWWGEAVRQRKPIIVNDYVSQSHPNKKGCPEGHAPLKRFLSLPVFDGEHIVSVVAVANKESDYDDSDVRALSNLTNDMWRMIRRKQDEEQIENLAKFPSENPNPVLRIARDGTLLYANDASESLLGEWNCHVGQTVGEWWRQRVSEAFESGSEKRVETEHAGRVFSFAIAPVAEAGYANLYGRDITERKLAEEELLRYASIVSSSSDMMAALDANFVYLAANEAYLAAFGMTRDEVVGHTVSEVFGEEFFETTIRPNAEGCLEGNKIRYENWFQFPVHGSRYMLVTYSPYTGPDGDIRGFVVNAKDITDREEAEQERGRLLKTLAAKNQELQDIVYIASHDLKTPLVNILGFSGELLKDLEQLENLLGKDKLEQSEKNAIENLVHNDIPQEVKFISSGGRMLKGLIDGMLQVSRIGSAKYTIEPINMNELVKEVVDGLEFGIRDSGVSVTVEELPDCLGDASKTSQLFGNLINNALKYLDPGRKGVIRIRGRCKDGRSEYCVEDNGIGIDASHQAKVFEIFHRLNPSDDISGEGLGLTIVVRILDQMDGTICLESEPGKGSKFFVSLPST